jgi:hypothetical protein
MGGAVGSLGGAANGSTGGAGGGDAGTFGGGGKGTVVEPYFRAGSRLKPRVFRVGDLEVLDGTNERSWYDGETGDWCMFRVGADGIERCFPQNMISEDTQSDQFSYLDAACTRPALRGSSHPRCDGTVPKYITVEPSSSCAYRTYRFGAARASDTLLYGKSGGSCRRLPAATDGLEVLPLEQEVPLEMFVAVKRVSRPRHPHMNALVREGEDGSSEIVGFSDPAHEAPCFGLGLDASPQACVPGWGLTGGNFSDAACTQGVAFDLAPHCSAYKSTALLEVERNAASCPFMLSVKGLWQSAGVRSTPVFTNVTNANGVCEALSTEPAVVQTQGASIDLASLPQLDVIEVGNGPLRLAFYGFDGVPFLPAPGHFENPSDGRFIDVARGETCLPYLFPEGKWFCVPSSFDFVMDFDLLYESEDCTGARAYSAPGRCIGTDTTPALRGIVVQTLMQEECANYRVMDTFELEGRSSATPLYRQGLGSSTCQRSNASDDNSNLLSPTKALNPAEVFVPMERKLSD